MGKATKTKVIRTSSASVASVMLEDTSVSIIGDKRNFITCNADGIIIRGPVSFVSEGERRRYGGLFTDMNDFVAMIPSTIVTPIPQKLPMPPIFPIISLAKDVTFFMALLI
jgi:hypothetical protein